MKEKVAIDEIANALQVINLLSTRLRQGLRESAQQAAKNASCPPVRSAVELTLLSLILRKPAFGFRTPPFDEVLCPIERGVLRARLRERVGFHRIDLLVRGRQRRRTIGNIRAALP